MRIHRYAPLAQLTAGVVLVAAIAGCGEGSGAAPPPPQPRVPLTTPQGAVASYIKAIEASNGNAICNALDESLRRNIMQKVMRARPAEAGAACAQALGTLAATITSPSERHAKLPHFHVRIRGRSAVVTYVGVLSHKRRNIALVKLGPGWLIDKIDGKG